jgi:hypothetical protein
MLQFTGHVYRDRDKNVIGASHLSPTDSVIATIGNKGMMRRLGNEIRPPLPSDTAKLLSTKNSGGYSLMDVAMIG